MELRLLPVVDYWFVAIASALLVALLFAVQPRSSMAPRRRRVLFALRALLTVLLILLLLRPTLVRTLVTKQAATLLVLLDASRSMLVEDSIGGRSRFEALKTSINDAVPTLQRLSEDLEIKILTFASEAESVELSAGGLTLPQTPEGEATAIGSVLEDALRREAGKRLAGVILMSDGAQRAYAPRDVPPQAPVRRLADLGYPLFAVPFGQSAAGSQSRDIAITEMLAPGQVFVKNSLDVSGTALFNGFVNSNVAVQLLFETTPGKMAPVAVANVRPTLDGQRLPIALEYIPETPGEYKVTLKALTPEGAAELVSTNNELSTFVTVLKGGLKVLYLEGALRPEQKFLRRALDASPDIQVDYLRIDPRDPTTRPDDFAERLTPGKYDVFILGDLDASAFRTEELTSMAAAVDAGGALLMLGGLHAFGAGGYAETPLAAVSPVELSKFERQNLDEPIRADLHVAGDLAMRPTDLGQRQRLMLLGSPEQNAALWAELPPLKGANRFDRGAVKRGAGVLAETPDGLPLMVAKDYGVGRAIAFAGDSTWRWALGGHDAEHRRFWRQVILWLARKDESTEGRVWIKLVERRYAPNSRVEWTLGAETAEGEPIENARFDVTVTLPNETKQPARLRSDGGATIGSFVDTQTAGDYVIQAQATVDGEVIGEARARFLVYEQDLELNNPAADRTTLESLAAMTGGRTIPPEKLPELIEEIQEATKALDVETLIKQELWDDWRLLVLIIAVFSAEWYLRKKWGLV